MGLGNLESKKKSYEWKQHQDKHVNGWSVASDNYMPLPQDALKFVIILASSDIVTLRKNGLTMFRMPVKALHGIQSELGYVDVSKIDDNYFVKINKPLINDYHCDVCVQKADDKRYTVYGIFAHSDHSI